MEWSYSAFSQEDIQQFTAPMKVGLLACVSPQAEPHISLISSLMAANPNQVIWGQFTEGLCKQYVQENPKTGFMIMSLDKDVWMGQADWTHTQTSGVDYDCYNNQPMFRYNAYFGIHTVHYMDLIGQNGKCALPMNAIVAAAVKTLLAKISLPQPANERVMNPWTQKFLGKIDGLKFLAYIDPQGYPVVFPIIQAQSANHSQILFSTSVFPEYLHAIPAGARVAIYGMALTMETVLTRGTFRGLERRMGVLSGLVDIDWVYNSMPPVAGQIYPSLPLETVKEF
jgi:hypothetical protein